MKTWQLNGLVPGRAQGPALISREPVVISRISTITGVLHDVGRPLNGRSLGGTILFMPATQGSSSGSYILLNLAARGVAPAALVLEVADAVVIAGAVLGNIPLVSGLPVSMFDAFSEGAVCIVDGASGKVQLCD